MLGCSGVSLIHLTPHMDYRSFHSFKAQKKITPGNCGITAFSPRTRITSNYHHVSWCSLMATVRWSNLLLDVESSQWVNVCDFTYMHTHRRLVLPFIQSHLHDFCRICTQFSSELSLCTIESPPPPPPPPPPPHVSSDCDKMQKQGLKKKKIPPHPTLTKQKTLAIPVTFTFKMQK